MSNVSSSKNPALKNFGGPLRIILVTLSIFVATQIVALLVTEMLAAVFTSQPLDSVLETSVSLQFVYILIAEALIFASLWLVLKRRQLGFKDIGYGRQVRWSDIGWALISYVGFIFCLLIVTAIITGLWHGYNTDELQDVGFKSISSSWEKTIAFISLVFLPPLGEETLMRGYLYTGLRRRWSFVAAGLFTSLFFGAAHLLTGQGGLLWAAAVSTFVLSLFLVYLREKTGALYAGIGLHALNNVLAFIVYFHS